MGRGVFVDFFFFVIVFVYGEDVLVKILWQFGFFWEFFDLFSNVVLVDILDVGKFYCLVLGCEIQVDIVVIVVFIEVELFFVDGCLVVLVIYLVGVVYCVVVLVVV